MKGEPSPLRDGVIFSKDENQEIQKREARRLRAKAAVASTFPDYLFPVPRIVDYFNEAENSLIDGCFRSCIICAAITVELALKHALISHSEQWEEVYWEIEVKKPTFARLIERWAKIGGLEKSVDHANWLQEVRNEITVHPPYVAMTFDLKAGVLETREIDQYIWASRTMLRDIRKLLRFLQPDQRKKFEEEKFSKRDGQGKILEEFTVSDYLSQQKPVRYEPGDFLYWRVLQNKLIEEIAFQAYERMGETINSLFPHARASEGH